MPQPTAEAWRIPSSSGLRRRERSTGPFPSAALDGSRTPLYRWFPDGELNTCYNAPDRESIPDTATVSPSSTTVP